MRAAITADMIRELKKDGTFPVDVWDTKFPGLVLRIRESGAGLRAARPQCAYLVVDRGA